MNERIFASISPTTLNKGLQPLVLPDDSELNDGLEKILSQHSATALTRVRQDLGVGVLLVEQYLEFAWEFAEKFLVMQKGRIVERGSTRERSASEVERWLSV